MIIVKKNMFQYVNERSIHRYENSIKIKQEEIREMIDILKNDMNSKERGYLRILISSRLNCIQKYKDYIMILKLFKEFVREEELKKIYKELKRQRKNQKLYI